MQEKTTHQRVYESTRWAVKLAGAELDCTFAELLSRVEHGDAKALAVWQRHARWVARQPRKKE